MQHTAIVVGAGIGGITAAAYLARNGYEVIVVEQLHRPGGRCGHLVMDGHQMDTGPTLYLMPEIYRRAFADLGEELEDHLDLCRVDPSYHLHFGDGSTLALTSDWERMRLQLETFEPGSYCQFQRYLDEGRRHYHEAMPNLVERNFRNLSEFASFKNLLLLFQLKVLKRHYANLARYFSDPRLKAAFTFQDMYLGLDPHTAPALFSMLPYSEFAHGVWFPKGGMYSVVESLERIAKNQGVQFIYGTPVERIMVDGLKTTGIQLADGTRLPAELVVANADLSYVYTSLLPDDSWAKRMERKRYGCSVLIFCWGLDKQFPQLEAHNLFLAEDYLGSLRPIFEDLSLASDPSFYVHVPTRVDPSMAPEGHESLMVAIPVGHIDKESPQDWDLLLAQARQAVIGKLRSIGLQHISDHIQVERCFSPMDFLEQLNLFKGSAHGLDHHLTQMGYFRPHNQHPKFQNLFFVGASTHPGTGVPTVLVSARLTVERILEQFSDPSLRTFQVGSHPSRRLSVDA